MPIASSLRSQSCMAGSFSAVALTRCSVMIRLGGIPSRHRRSIAASVLAVASRVRSSVPFQRASLSSPGPSMEMPTCTWY